MKKQHNFHIPVMGVAYTIDSPLKVAPYGIDSVISLVDNVLLEKLRETYTEKFNLPYQAITEKMEDFRAKRITAYLNMIHDLTVDKFQAMKDSYEAKKEEIHDYFEMLPDTSELKAEFYQKIKNLELADIKDWLKDHLQMGSIDVNIMTKVDKTNYQNGEPLPSEFNDAHAALRGYANSKLESSLILSAGMSPRLYAYLENFPDFYPDKEGNIKKKVVLKVSDYRSALIQGKFLAKKGIWVSEYRIESGLNCGGHAFATDGFLMGPILEEFKQNRELLKEQVLSILKPALEAQNKPVPKDLELKITAQGGVGTAEEHDFLIDYYGMDSIGWGTPFLLVPEATTVDDYTRKELAKAKVKDLYLSDISPLGVPFNSLRTSSATLKKLQKAEMGRPGSPCPKEYLVSNTEFTEKPICTASRQYQHAKLKELQEKKLPEIEFKQAYDKIIAPECLCVGLSEPAIITHNIDYKIKDMGTTVCPGPNMAYFDKVLTLKEMVGHIYGRLNVMNDENRPHMFIKELNLYMDYLKDRLNETGEQWDKRQQKYFEKFASNLHAGIEYYQDLFSNTKGKFEDIKSKIFDELSENKNKLKSIFGKISAKINA
jgi:hypothetical protein